MNLRHIASAFAVVVWTGCVSADSVAVDLTQYATGSRTTGTNTGLAVSELSGWSSSGVKLSWNISQSGNLFTYVYTWSKLDGSLLGGAPSHMLLEVSPTYTAANTFSSTTDAQVFAPAVYLPQGAHGSDPFLPAAIFGIKFDYTADSYTLVTDRAPIWGDIYTKDGTSDSEGTGHDKPTNAAWNTGFGIDPTSATINFTAWVPTPDTLTIVPLPAAAWAGMALMLSVFGISRVKSCRRSCGE